MSNGTESDEPVTDVLAAEEFVLPAADPAFRPEHLKLPPDPVSEEEPHDVLAAEEFAMPAPDEAHVPPHGGGKRTSIVRLIGLKLAVLAVGLWFWRRSRGRNRLADGASSDAVS